MKLQILLLPRGNKCGMGHKPPKGYFRRSSGDGSPFFGPIYSVLRSMVRRYDMVTWLHIESKAGMQLGGAVEGGTKDVSRSPIQLG